MGECCLRGKGKRSLSYLLVVSLQRCPVFLYMAQLTLCFTGYKVAPHEIPKPVRHDQTCHISGLSENSVKFIGFFAVNLTQTQVSS